jgi:hypothetical protein
MPSRLSASSRTPWQGPRASVRHAKWLVAGCPAPVAIGRLAVVSLPLHLSHAYKPYAPGRSGESSPSVWSRSRRGSGRDRDRCRRSSGRDRSNNGPTRLLFTDPAGRLLDAGAAPRAPAAAAGRAINCMKKTITAYPGRGSRFVRFGPYTGPGRRGRAGARAGGVRPAATCARGGEAGTGATAEDEPRRRPRGAAAAFVTFQSRAESPERARKDTTDGTPRRITASSPLDIA